MKASTWILIGRGMLAPIALCLLWFVISVSDLVDPLFVPGPYSVFRAGVQMLCDSKFWGGMVTTLWRMLAGFGLAGIAAIPLGIMLGYMRHAYSYSEFIIDFLRSVPATALYPLFMLVFGIGDKSKIAIVAFACFFVILINSIYGVWNAPKTRVIMAKTFRATRCQIFSKIVLFDALPNIFAGLRNALSIALIMAVVAEMFIGTRSGLGFIIMNSKLAYDTPTMYAVIIVLGAIGYLSSRGLLLIERKVIHWSRA
jgi:NitT/TauT family transport system permease protein